MSTAQPKASQSQEAPPTAPCENCNGEGFLPSAPSEYAEPDRDCPVCHGLGVLAGATL